jgi:hypothetical protein
MADQSTRDRAKTLAKRDKELVGDQLAVRQRHSICIRKCEEIDIPVCCHHKGVLGIELTERVGTDRRCMNNELAHRARRHSYPKSCGELNFPEAVDERISIRNPRAPQEISHTFGNPFFVEFLLSFLVIYLSLCFRKGRGASELGGDVDKPIRIVRIVGSGFRRWVAHDESLAQEQVNLHVS